jgi:hypothetical protein
MLAFAFSAIAPPNPKVVILSEASRLHRDAQSKDLQPGRATQNAHTFQPPNFKRSSF